MVGRREVLLGAAAAAMLPGRLARAADDPIRVPIELSPSRVLVTCSVAGQGPFRFVFDTGGTIGLMDEDLVRQLKLKLVGHSRLGLSDRPGIYPIYQAPDIVFGGVVRQPSGVFAAIRDFGFGQGVVGSLAAGLLSAVNGELDYDAAEWRIYRDGLPDRDGWTRYEKAIVHKGNLHGSAFLLADAKLGEESFRFGVDTGMPSMLRIYRKTAERAGLWNAEKWSPGPPGGKARIVRAPTLTLAGTEMKGVMVSIMDDPQWDVFDAGVIGLPILRLFNMATEVKTSALYLRRNRQLPALPRYNRAGIWFERDGNRTRVGIVGPGSPAQAAGLKSGDIILTPDFDALVAQSQGARGSVMTMTVEQGGVRRSVDLVLTDFL